MGQLLWRRVWQFLKKLNTELSSTPEIPLLGICPGKRKTQVEQPPLHPGFLFLQFQFYVVSHGLEVDDLPANVSSEGQQ